MSLEINKNIIELGFDVAEHTNAMLAYWDKNLICRYANNAYSDWFGISPDQMIDKISLRTLLGPLYEKNKTYINGALEGRKQDFERLIPVPSGAIRAARATYVPDFKGEKVVGFYVLVADITPISDIENSNDLKRVEGSSDPSQNFDRLLDEVVETLRSCLLTEFPGIPQLSKKHYISESKLKRGFKEKYNSTIFSYYRHLQMELAFKYITEKKCNKSQMAAMLNFSNPSNFSICYQKYLKENSTNELIREIQKENDERYQAFIEQAPMAIAMVDTDLRFITASKKWIADFDLENTAYIGESVYNMYDGFESKYGEMLSWCLKGNSKSCDEEFVERPDGSTAWMRWDIRPWYKRQNQVGGLLVLTENITEMKSKEDESKKISAILNKTSEIAHIGVWKRNFRTRTGICSKILKDILEVPEGVNPDIVADFDFYKPGSDRELAKKLFKDAIENGQQFEFDAEIITAKQNSKWVRVIGYPDFLNGKCEKISGIFQDITNHHIIS